MVLFILLAGGGGGATLRPSFSTRLALVAFTVAIVWFDRRRAREELLTANLGGSPVWIWALSAGVAITLDLATQAIASTW
jgi:hypothetical protein